MAQKKLSEQRARRVANDLLSFRGWDTNPINKGGQQLEENEYRHYATLASIFEGKSKTGDGYGKPDFLLVESATSLKPTLVIETKGSSSEANDAIKEAIHYGEACYEQGHAVIAVGIAGSDEEIAEVIVRRRIKDKWVPLTLNDEPIDWIPSQEQVHAILASATRTKVDAECPSDDVLQSQADRMNEILRESKIGDAYRPVYVATIMLALWQGDISVDPDVVLEQINANAKRALVNAGKAALAQSLRVDEDNSTLAKKAWEIVDILKKLNIRSFLQEHDYLGQLYETFFVYTGKNTIGQIFTPRHAIGFMCELVDVRPEDKVFDPTVGTGGMLIGALKRMVKEKKRPYAEAIKLVRKNLFGMETEPSTAALCITNMILRGDGKCGIIRKNCFEDKTYAAESDIVLMNPPFPHDKKNDTPTTDYIDRGLLSLRRKGLLATVVPYSLLVSTGEWHQKILKGNTLKFVATCPADLFQPYASYNTAIVVIEKGVPHGNKDVFFARISNDGFKVKKKARVAKDGTQMPALLSHYKKMEAVPQLCCVHNINADSAEWSPEAYIESAAPSESELMNGFEEHIRNHAAFYLRYGNRLIGATKREDHKYGMLSGEMLVSYMHHPIKINAFVPLNIGKYFDVILGGKEEVEDLEEDGNVPIVTTSEFMNGVTSWKGSENLYDPTVITVATDGSICSSFVQEFHFYAFYKVAILTPKPEYKIPEDALYFIAYLLKRERWRYVFARKFGKGRLLDAVVYVPAKNGKPDFEAMAKLSREQQCFDVISEFRKLYREKQATIE